MQAYGKRKRGSSKIHPHNECGLCSENNISKKTERQEAMKNIISQQIDIKENKMDEKTIEDWDSIIARLNELEQNDLAEELARFLGVSRPTITRWMKKQTIPHPAMMESLIKKIKEEHIKEDK